MRCLTAIGLAALLAGCATAPPATTPTAGGGNVFSGEVWTWDERDSTVTLRQYDNRTIRVKVDPATLRTLQLHQMTRVTGTPAPPSDLVVMKAASPVTPVPTGPADAQEVTGTVSAVEPSGRLALDSDRGPIHVWVAQGADQRFTKGSKVTVRMSVQPVNLVPAGAGVTPPAPTPLESSASPSSEPGDHAVVTGRLIGVNPNGMLVVESPTGPIQVWMADASRYKVGDAVQVRTTVRPQP